MSDSEQSRAPLEGIGMRAWVMAELHPRFYLPVAVLAALAGYACLALFPALVLAGLAGMYLALTAAGAIDWLALLVWLPVTACGGLISYRLAGFRPALPAGVVLERVQAPALFELVQDTADQFPGGAIDRILITGDYRLEIIATPRNAVPLRPQKTLLIGLPLLRLLSAARFRCLLARRIGQFSGRSNRLLNWLNRLRTIWPCYSEPQCTVPACLPLRLLFTPYASLYRALSAPAARLDELQADSYAMELFNDEQVLDAITADAVFRTFLDEKYWPAIRKLGDAVASAITKSHAGMVAVVHSGLQPDNIGHWVARAMDREQVWNDSWPPLARRLENIGHAHACMALDAGAAGADGYLAMARQDLEAALEDLPRPEAASPQAWSLHPAGLQQRVQVAVRGFLHRNRISAPSDDQAGELRQ